MSFQFQRCANPEIGEFAYEMPPMPYGVSYSLQTLISAYTSAVISGPDQAADECFEAIANFEAKDIPDTIAKLLIRIHYDHSGLDDDRLVLCSTAERHTAILVMEPLLTDLYRQMPATWADQLRVCRSALLAEREYDQRFWRPAYDAHNAGGPKLPDAIEAEMERLQHIRCDAEDLLIAMPAPSLTEFAIKYLIAFSCGRDLNGWHDHLCDEARRLVGIDMPKDADELTALLANLDWSVAA
tara:strand:- start:2435 stop:3157 length:723 start_codon:yes stop_codon:yes gene_type:complete